MAACWADLPAEVKLQCFAGAEPSDLGRLARLSRYYNGLIKGNKLLFKDVYLQHWVGQIAFLFIYFLQFDRRFLGGHFLYTTCNIQSCPRRIAAEAERYMCTVEGLDRDGERAHCLIEQRRLLQAVDCKY